MRVAPAAVAGARAAAGVAAGQGSFVNWESPHVHPLELAPGGMHLLAVNTAGNRLEVFAVGPGGLVREASIPVGLEPVSVRARTATEAWVANHISDSVSIVDLTARNVVATIYPGDEPADVVFAGNPQRAFVSVSQLNQVHVYDPLDLAAAPVVIPIAGEDPRGLATDGRTVWAAIFESGNRTTVLGEETVSSGLNPYPGEPNPPPNSGGGFDPPMRPGLEEPPGTSLIVRKGSSGAWRDVNGANWSAAVTWNLHDHDVAIIDARTLLVSYATGLMNANMAIAAHPGGGATVVGTDAINHVRFESNVNGIFLRVKGASVAGPGAPAALVDLNPHLTYDAPRVPQAVRDLSVGDPRAVAWRAAGDRGFVAGMGSNNVAVVDASLQRTGLVDVGEGPTGLAVDEVNDRVYVLNRFESTISIIDGTGTQELGRVGFHDASPPVIRDGRPFLYDTHRTSGLGQAACASCHIDGRMDQLAWDLGDPRGEVKPFNQECNFGLGGCEDWHPMKGPMTTQTLVGMTGTEPLHWRGDREDLAAFNGAFEGLLGDDTQLTPEEMDRFLAFVATLQPPPNPFREIDGELPFSLPGGGLPWIGEFLFDEINLDLFVFSCRDCHAAPAGTNGMLVSGGLLGETQSVKVPQLGNLYEKTGFDVTRDDNNRGFGFIHDGSVDTLVNFLQFGGFVFAPGDAGDQQRRDVVAFLMCFSTETPAATGLQVTLPQEPRPGQRAGLQELLGLAGDELGLVAKGSVGGEERGYVLVAAGIFQSDRAAESIAAAALAERASPGSEITLTLVPAQSAVRIGVDRDEDGYFDRDELDAGSDPADPESTPENVLVGDLDGDGVVGGADLALLLSAWGPCDGECPADLDRDGAVGLPDLLLMLLNWS